MRPRLLAALALLSALAWASATSYRALSLDEMLAQTDLAFYGEVESTAVEAKDGEPWTLVTFAVREALLGLDEGAETVTLAFYGGTLESGESVRVSLMPEFEAGEVVLVLAYRAGYYSPIVGFRQGLWRETERGLTDEAGRVLSLSEVGALAPDGQGGATDALLAALRAALEARP